MSSPSQRPSAKQPTTTTTSSIVFTILMERKDLYDTTNSSSEEIVPAERNDVEVPTQQQIDRIGPYAYVSTDKESLKMKCSILKVPSKVDSEIIRPSIAVDRSVPNPLKDEMEKYWNQRRRLFRKFDQGIILDTEGWFSVTPEQIAAHVAQQVAVSYGPMVVLDAFGGCGGNAIGFCQRPEIAQVVCVDLDRQKLRATAHNASIYGIPKDKMILVECNVIFLLQFCYKNGHFILDSPIENAADAMAMMAAMPPAVPMEHCEGFPIGGIDLLPREIHLVFMDPPWGGVDYNAFGRYGYSLQEHMRIPRLHSHLKEKKAADSFFDSFAPTNPQERKAAFNCALDETNCVNGAELLRLAASASRDAAVVYDIPRNTNRTSLAEAAVAAGYRGNCKLDEHHLNGRLKTVTAYFGKDWRTTLFGGK